MLHESDQTMTWHEFVGYLTGLLSADTRLARHFAPQDTQDKPQGEGD